MRLQLGLLAALAMLGTASLPQAAAAQVETPANCHWAPVQGAPATVELWCRANDGKARRTGRTMQQGPASAPDGCPRGKVYDGVGCVSEYQALAAEPQYIPELPPTPWPAARTEPRIYMYQDRNGRNRYGEACTDQQNVTICQPIPRH